MQTKTDAQLLREYARTGSEPAFGELVSRHADLVCSAALRQVIEPDCARDVAQSPCEPIVFLPACLCELCDLLRPLNCRFQSYVRHRCARKCSRTATRDEPPELRCRSMKAGADK